MIKKLTEKLKRAYEEADWDVTYDVSTSADSYQFEEAAKWQKWWKKNKKKFLKKR